nr:hypothetical protein [Tanacetum cinerariifolium]
MIFSRQVNRGHILDFEGLRKEIREALADRLRMVYTRAEGQPSAFQGKVKHPKVTSTDLLYLRSTDEGTTVNVSYLLAQYLFRHTEGRKRGARISVGYFVRRLAEYFGLVSDEGLIGLTTIARELPLIDMDELVIPAPLQAPQPPLAAAPTRTMPQRMTRLEKEVHRMHETLGEQREVLD